MSRWFRLSYTLHAIRYPLEPDMPTLMTRAKMLTLEEAARRLGVTSHEVDRLVAEGQLPAYNIGGQFVRFRHDDVEAVARGRRRQGARRAHDGAAAQTGWRERLREFFYLHDFYVLAALLTLLLIDVLVRFA